MMKAIPASHVCWRNLETFDCLQVCALECIHFIELRLSRGIAFFVVVVVYHLLVAVGDRLLTEELPLPSSTSWPSPWFLNKKYTS